MAQLEGKVAVVTGAAQGIGRAIADGLAAERVETRGEMAVRPVCLDERHRRRDRPPEPASESALQERHRVRPDHRRDPS